MKTIIKKRKIATGLRLYLAVMLVFSLFMTPIFSTIPFASAETAPATQAQMDESDQGSGTVDKSGTGSVGQGATTGTDADAAGADTTDTVDSSSGSPVVSGDTKAPQQQATEVAALGASIAPLMQQNGSDSLQFFVGDAQAGWQDVDTIGNATDWSLSTTQRQVQLRANFADVGITKNRTIEISIPKGMKILEYSAKSGTTAMSGVTQLQLSAENDPKLTSSVLSASDGSVWVSQVVSGYNPQGSQTPADWRIYDGKVLYTLNSNCDQITLTLTLGLDQKIMPHNASSTVLDSVSVNMHSGATSLSTHLSTTVKDLAIPALNPANIAYNGSRTIEGNPDTGEVSTFITGFTTPQTNVVGGYQTSYADSNVMVFSYPHGTAFQGFTETITGTNQSTSATGGTFAAGHLQVISDPAARTVTFIYDKVTMTHQSNAVISLYWTADMNQVVGSTWDGSAVPIKINSSMSEQSGGAINHLTPHSPQSGLVTITVKKPAWDIKLTALNRVRYDLNAQGDYPYEYLLGSIKVNNTGPSGAPNLTYTWNFDETLGVRAVNFPGFNSSTNTIRDVQATIAGPSGTRTLALTGKTFNASNSQYNGINVRAEDFGLASDEYLVEVIAKQDKLDAYNYDQSITKASASYYGRWQNGQTGNATLTLTDGLGFSATATDHTTIGHTTAGAGVVNTIAKKADGTTGSFYPTDSMVFTSEYAFGTLTNVQNDIVDPIVIISLPKGIVLDQTSVKAISKAGNYADGSSFDLKPLGMTTHVIDGVEWSVYKYQSYNHQDMIAQAENMQGVAYKSNTFSVNFSANVSSACETYPEIKAEDIVAWDLGASAVSCTWGTDYTIPDTHNKGGHGASYRLVAGVTSTELAVVQKPGLNVALGVRTAGSGISFYTYDGTLATIAPVTPNQNAEILLSYTNTSDSSYFPGSEIYLPIPKKSLQYASFFSNKSSDPYNQSDNVSPEYSSSLIGALSLAGFDTYYAFDTSGATSGGTVDSNWTPVSYAFYTVGNFPAGKSFADVAMVKFVANAEILNAVTGTTTFEVSIDQDAVLGQTDFWRSYQKGWRNAGSGGNNGDGTWVFGSVLAAETAKAGVSGFIFNDANLNGIKDLGEAGYTGDQITALLTEKNGGIVPLAMTINPDGSFASLNTNGTQYHLKEGDYIVTITNSDISQYFSTTTGATRSTSTDWFMDIAQAKIATNQASATYEFNVLAGASLSSEYLGVGVKTAATLTYSAGTGITNWATQNPSEYVRYNNSPATIPAIGAANAATGYNMTTQKWTLDKAVTLKDSTPIAAGVALSRAQLANVKVAESLVATVSLDLLAYTVSVSVVGNIGGSASATPTTVNYNNSSVLETTSATGYELDYIQVNGVGITPVSGGYTIANIQEDQSVVVKFKPINYAITYNLDSGSMATANPATYNIETPQFTLNNPTKTGYIFSGWTGTDLGSATTAVNVGPNATGVRIYTATWQPCTDTAYTVEHYWQQTGGTYVLHETDNNTGETAAVVSAKPKTYTYYTENMIHPNPVASGTIAADGSTILKLYYDKTIFDLTFDSQGADQAGTLDVLSLVVPQNTLITSASGFPASPTKTGYVFHGWKLPDGTTWVISSTTMPAQDTLLAAVWEPGWVVVSGDITIVAYNFAMSLSQAQAHQANNPAGQLAELIARGQAKAWWTNSLQDVAISYAQVQPSSGNGKSIDAAVGDYYVTYYALDQEKTAQVTVLASVYDNLAPGSGIGCSNFTYNIKGGALSEAKIRSLGKVSVYDQWGNKTTEAARINPADLAYINRLINAGQTKDVSVRFTNAFGDEVTVIVTLVKDPEVIPPPGVSPIPVTPPVSDVVYPAEQPAAPQTTPKPLLIKDNQTPLAGQQDCWVHFWIIAGIVITLICGIAVVIRRRKFTSDLDDFEYNVLGNDYTPVPHYISPGFDTSKGQEIGA